MTLVIIGFTILFLLLIFRPYISTQGWDQYYLAQNKTKPLFIAGSIAATTLGGSATLWVLTLWLTNGINALWVEIGAICGLFILAFYVAKPLYNIKGFTLVDLIPKNKKIAAFVLIATQLLWLTLLFSALISLPWELQSPYFKIPQFVTYLWILLPILYLIRGGQKASIQTDILQILFMALFLGLVIFLLKPLATQQILKPSWFSTIPKSTSLIGSLSLGFHFMFSHAFGPDMATRIWTAKNANNAKSAAYIAALIRIVFVIGISYLGWNLSSMGATPNTLFSTLLTINSLAPNFLFLFFILALVSSIDTILMSLSAIMETQIFQHRLSAKKRFIILLGFSLIAFLCSHSESLSFWAGFAYASFTAGFMVPVVLKLQNRPIPSFTSYMLPLFWLIFCLPLFTSHLTINTLSWIAWVWTALCYLISRSLNDQKNNT